MIRVKFEDERVNPGKCEQGETPPLLKFVDTQINPKQIT